MKQQDPAVLTFDVVGTLIDFEGGMIGYIRKACGSAAAALEDDTILAAYRKSRASKESIRFPDYLVRVYGEIAPQLGLRPDKAIAEEFRNSIRLWPAFPDSVDALKRLKKRFKLVAMTNAQRWALEYMARTLGDPFDDTVTVDEAGVMREARPPFLRLRPRPPEPRRSRPARHSARCAKPVS